MNASDPARTLEILGFSLLEAEVYVLLLQHPSSSGYRIAQELGKAAAGIYKALDALAKRGAVVVDDDGTKSWRAVPAPEMLAQMERGYRRRHQAAAKSLANLGAAAADERVYRLKSFNQVVERARHMLGTAKETAVVDLFPACVDLVREDVARATERGVRVMAKLYAPAELRVSYKVVTPAAERLLEAWRGGDWLNVVIDAEEHLLALLHCADERVHQAVWTSSTYLSILYYSGISSEIGLDALGAAIERGARPDEINKLYRRHRQELSAVRPLGFLHLRSQLQLSDADPS